MNDPTLYNVTSRRRTNYSEYELKWIMADYTYKKQCNNNKLITKSGGYPFNGLYAYEKKWCGRIKYRPFCFLKQIFLAHFSFGFMFHEERLVSASKRATICFY